MRRFYMSSLLTGLLAVFFLSSAASAQVSWDKVKKKALNAKSYSVLYKYKGPRGRYDFNYGYTRNAIRSEILRAKNKSRVGTIVVWDKKWNPKRVRAKTGGGLIVRKTSHKDVKDTPFHRSIFKMVIDQADRMGKPKSKKAGKNTLFSFSGGKYKIWANAKGEILKTQRKDGRDDEIRRFSGHKWNNSPKVTF